MLVWDVSHRISLCSFLPPTRSIRVLAGSWWWSCRLWQGSGGEKDVMLCGVFDGHEPHGHLVARGVRDALPLRLMSVVRASKVGMDMTAAARRKAFQTLI
jgi:hypothetical protein